MKGDLMNVEPEVARKQSPLREIHEELGASFTDFAGWAMPLRYGSELAEHRSVRQAAGLFDLSHMAEIEVSGQQAAAMLDHALVGNLAGLVPGRARYTMLCAPDGGILDDLVVYRLAENHFLVVANAANTSVVVTELSLRGQGFAAQVVDRSLAYALIAVQGPNSAGIVESLLDPERFSLGALRYYASAQVAVNGAMRGYEVLLARTGYTGEDGFELYVSAEDAVDVWRLLTRAGTSAGLLPAGLACRDTLRLEAGMPLYGNELTDQITPFEANLGRIVAFGKPEFVGRSALMSHQSRDQGDQGEQGKQGKEIGRRLVGLRGTGRRAPRGGYRIFTRESDEQVGVVTSGALSPTLGYPIAMAYLDAEYTDPGTSLLVDIRGRVEAVEVVSLPFYRRAR
jgi:aminomethyltransferase